jgi:hypothetical protein
MFSLKKVQLISISLIFATSITATGNIARAQDIPNSELKKREEEAKVRTLEAGAAKAEAEAAKAEADANLSRFKLPPIDSTNNPSGAITLEEKKDKINFESTILAYQALEQVAKRIYADLKNNNAKAVVVIDEEQQKKLDAYQSFISTVRLLESGYRKELGEPQSGFSFLAVPGLVAETISKTLSFFRTESTISPVAITINSDALISMLVKESTNDNPGADNPGASNPGADNPGASNPGADNPGASNSGADNPGASNPGADNPNANATIKFYNPNLFTTAFGGTQLSSGANDGILKQLQSLFDLRKKAKDIENPTLKTLNEQTDKLINSLLTIEENTGTIALSTLADAYQIIDLRNTQKAKLLVIKIDAGGSNKTTKGIFNGGLYHSGGVIVRYQIIDQKGQLELGDVKYENTGYQKLNGRVTDSEP